MRFWCVLLVVFAVLSPLRAAHADALDDVLAQFATDRFPDTDKAIADLAAAPPETGPAILAALYENRLYFDPASRQVVIRTAEGSTLDAKTGTNVPDPPADLKRVRLNNALRGKIDAARGVMSLLAPDPAKRREAADAVFKSHDPAALGALDAALAKEGDPDAKRALGDARAAVVLAQGGTDADRLSAVATMRARGDTDALNLLGAATAGTGPVAEAAQAAVAAIQSRQALWQYVQNVWYGLSLGSVLLLAAIGLAITFGVMGVINMAHGEMVMIGAYTTFVTQEVIRAHAPGLFGASLFIALPLAFLVSGAVGILIERLVISHLYGRPLETLLATWGVSLILQQAVRTVFGANNREVGAPAFMSGSFDFGGLAITTGRMWIIVFTILVFIALQVVLRATSFGLAIRAVTQNRRMAGSMGISSRRIDALAFGLGSGIAGIAGVALSQIDNVSPNLGQSYIIDSFMVVVFGGVGNLWGTLVAALTLGVANKLLEPLVGAVLGKILVLVFIILFIQKRPRGLFALKGRAVEA